jgi:putative transposase
MSIPFFKEGYSIKDQFATHFLTFTICGWIDLFTRKEYKDVLISSFKYAQSQDQLILYAYVIMSNHVHLIARANEDQKKH